MEGDASRWRFERTLDGIGSGVLCLVAWGDRVAGGCLDGGIRVWSSETWALERTLRGYGRGVYGMAVTGRGLISSSGRKLISSYHAGIVRVWSTETWDCVQTVEAYPARSMGPGYIRCLAVCGQTLVGGAYSGTSIDREGEVRVWDLETLRPLHTLMQPAGADVWLLVCDGREVWGAVGKQVVVWGRRG